MYTIRGDSFVYKCKINKFTFVNLISVYKCKFKLFYYDSSVNNSNFAPLFGYMTIETLHNWYTTYKAGLLTGRYVHNDLIVPFLDKLRGEGLVKQIGASENNLPIHLIKLGKGSKKLLFWSQMHGNESTTTKAIFDLINLLLRESNPYIRNILEECTIYIIPILNPDGAKLYTRLNYNEVDLNRDAKNKTQKESIILSDLIRDIKPDFAFNLHGQRTIFSAGRTNNTATVSFLSPAGNNERTITDSRKISMEIIAKMNTVLQECIPNKIGRYDDQFNINCIGDTLENIGIPTILFEAGHYKDDYERETTRKYIFYAFVTSLGYIAANEVKGESYREYFLIPENEKCFYDLIIRNVELDGKIVDIAIQYVEKLIDKGIVFVPKIERIDNLEKYYGHKEIVGEKRKISSYNDIVEVVEGNKMLNIYLNNELFSIELVKN